MQLSRPISRLCLAIGCLGLLGLIMNARQADSLRANEALQDKADKQAEQSTKQKEEKPEEKADKAEKAEKADKAEKNGRETVERHVYMRVTRDEQNKPLALQTAIVHFVSARGKRRGATVDLVGAVHVGDDAYYRTLNEKFAEYDVVLYELVAPEGTRIPKGGREGGGGGVIGGLQNGMKSVLGLSHQLNKIDYTAKNLVHADMTPEEFAKAMDDRGESWLQMYFRTLGYSMATQASGSGGDLSLLIALFSGDRERQLKIILAQQFEQSEGMIGALEGPEGSAIITARNGKAFEILQREIKQGHKRIAVFYGAGHLHDMEQRLIRDFDLKRSSDSWVDAWNLAPGK